MCTLYLFRTLELNITILHVLQVKINLGLLISIHNRGKTQ